METGSVTAEITISKQFGPFVAAVKWLLGKGDLCSLEFSHRKQVLLLKFTAFNNLLLFRALRFPLQRVFFKHGNMNRD